jgi:hypothetical protein
MLPRSSRCLHRSGLRREKVNTAAWVVDTTGMVFSLELNLDSLSSLCGTAAPMTLQKMSAAIPRLSNQQGVFVLLTPNCSDSSDRTKGLGGCLLVQKCYFGLLYGTAGCYIQQHLGKHWQSFVSGLYYYG